jgi:hypothetical protein
MIFRSLPLISLLYVVIALGYSALIHIDNSHLFLDTILKYKLLPITLAVFCAGYLPFLQLTLAIGLVLNPGSRRWCFAMCILLFLAFLGMQLQAYFRNLDISCGCFGTSATAKIGWQSLSLPAIGIVCSLMGFITTPGKESTKGESHEKRAKSEV